MLNMVLLNPQNYENDEATERTSNRNSKMGCTKTDGRHLNYRHSAMNWGEGWDSIVCLCVGDDLSNRHSNVLTFLQRMPSASCVCQFKETFSSIFQLHFGNSCDNMSSGKRSYLYCSQQTDFLWLKSMSDKICFRKSFVIRKFPTPNLMAFESTDPVYMSVNDNAWLMGHATMSFSLQSMVFDVSTSRQNTPAQSPHINEIHEYFLMTNWWWKAFDFIRRDR